jgi:hypothetical protein
MQGHCVVPLLTVTYRCEQAERAFGVACGVPEGAGDAGVAGQAQDADDQVPDRGHDVGAGAGAYLGQVLAEGDVADPVQLVLYFPVPADPFRELGRPGLLRGQ